MREPEMDEPVLTRRADGARFTITMQARSPDGPCDLRGVAPPHEVVHTTNDRVLFDFIDPRKGVPTCAKCRADKVHHPAVGGLVCLTCDASADARATIDTTGIPTPDDIVRGRTRKAREEAAGVMMTLRKHFTAGCAGGSVKDLATVTDGALALVNDALATKGWRLDARTSQRDGAWCELVAITAKT